MNETNIIIINHYLSIYLSLFVQKAQNHNVAII